MKLYDLTEAQLLMAARIDGAETPDALPTEAELDELFGDYNAKVNGYCRFIRNLEAEAEAVEAEEKRLATRKKSLNSQAAYLKERLLASMITTRTVQIVAGPFKVTVRETPFKVFVDTDPSNLPEEYRREKTTVEADKTALLEAFKRGDELPAGVSAIKGSRLDIK